MASTNEFGQGVNRPRSAEQPGQLSFEELVDFAKKYIDVSLDCCDSACMVIVCPECKVIHVGPNSNYCEVCDRCFAKCGDHLFVGTKHENICRNCDCSL